MELGRYKETVKDKLRGFTTRTARRAGALVMLALTTGGLMAVNTGSAEATINGVAIVNVQCPKPGSGNLDVTLGVSNSRSVAVTVGVQETLKNGTVIDKGPLTIGATSGEPISFKLEGTDGIEDGSVKLTESGQPNNFIVQSVDCIANASIPPETTTITATTLPPPSTTTGRPSTTTTLPIAITTTTGMPEISVTPTTVAPITVMPTLGEAPVAQPSSGHLLALTG